MRNGYSGNWRPAEVMPEIVNTETGERQNGTWLAGMTWKEYLAYAGRATYKTGLAYALTQDEKYAEKSVELMRLYAQQYTQQHWWALFDVPYYQGAPIQTSSRVASNSSYGSNWQFKWHCQMLSLVSGSPAWTPEIRKEVYDGFAVPFATELTKLPGSISNQTDISNHNLILLGLFFDDATMVYFGTLTDAGLIKRLQDIDSDGFSAEGRPLNYHFAAMHEYLPAVTYLENSGLNLKYGKERIINAVRMPYERATISGEVPNAGDIGRGARIGASPYADELLAIAPDQTWLRKIGQGKSIIARLRAVLSDEEVERGSWRDMIGRKPKLFSEAGFAILRTGDTAEEQVMLTFDYGRSVFHDGYNRGQITLAAFGKIYTQGPGSRYNAGRGGIEFNRDPRFASFVGYHSLGHNVVTVDQQSQLRTVGELVSWGDQPELQYAVANINGAYPGVAHTRGVLLANGIVLLFDRLSSEASHSYDFVYHNFGELKPGEGWTRTPLDKPIGTTGNYDNIVDPASLTGSGMIRLTWDLSKQYPHWRDEKDDPSKHLPHRLNLWQLPIEGGKVFTGKTGLNNHNTAIISDEAPTLIHRVNAKDVYYVTVLEPFKGESRVTAVKDTGNGQVTVTTTDGAEITASLDDLIRWGKQ